MPRRTPKASCGSCHGTGVNPRSGGLCKCHHPRPGGPSVLDVACPYCGAAAGFDCRGLRGGERVTRGLLFYGTRTVAAYHPSRWSVARRERVKRAKAGRAPDGTPLEQVGGGEWWEGGAFARRAGLPCVCVTGANAPAGAAEAFAAGWSVEDARLTAAGGSSGSR